ncbi:uncharacterized protein LOC129966845 [Argiope bruennichi]|uniref:uncharacterized protein LOC129966845 n=1 Tax=Argiope bruennichi TaxID=94029 RepID=UPI002493DF29|nr:uncharacterized protein LOC129966845 [Argiope bruennichi]
MSRTYLGDVVGRIYPRMGSSFLNLSADQNLLLHFNIVFIKAYLLIHVLGNVIPMISAITLSSIMILFTALQYPVSKCHLFVLAMWFGINFLAYYKDFPSFVFAYVIISSFREEIIQFFMDVFVLLGLIFFLISSSDISKIFNTNFYLQRNLLIQYLVLQFIMLFQLNQQHYRRLSVISILFTSVMLSLYVDRSFILLFNAVFYDVCLLFFYVRWIGIKMLEEQRRRELDPIVF